MSNPKEKIHRCPKCGLATSTAALLKAHQCKGALVVAGRRPLTLAGLEAMPLSIIGESQDVTMGRQLTEQWERVKDSRKQDLIFGAMMLKVRERIDSARGNKSHEGKGRYEKGTGLKAWMEEHAPSVSRSVAERLMEIAEGVRESFSIGGKVDLEALLTAQIESLDAKLAKQRGKIEEMIEGKSQRQLLLEFGAAEKKPRGGARGVQGVREPETAESSAAHLRALCVHGGETLNEIHEQAAWMALNEADLDGFIEHCERTAKEAVAWRKLSKSERRDRFAALVKKQLAKK